MLWLHSFDILATLFSDSTESVPHTVLCCVLVCVSSVLGGVLIFVFKLLVIVAYCAPVRCRTALLPQLDLPTGGVVNCLLLLTGVRNM